MDKVDDCINEMKEVYDVMVKDAEAKFPLDVNRLETHQYQR